MVRAFTPDPIDPAVLRRVLDAGHRHPSAGWAQGTDFLVLEGPGQTASFWDVSLPPSERDGFPWPRLLDAPVLVLPLADPGAYLNRYGEPDKARSGLGEGQDRWPVPYWQLDTAMAAMLVLLAAEDEGLGALFFGIFAHEDELLARFGVPVGIRPIGAIALGHPVAERASRSLDRRRRSLDEAVHRGRWGQH
jgi:nitroreductase